MDQRGDGQVLITGFGAVTPAGNDREPTWRSLVEGRSTGHLIGAAGSLSAMACALAIRDGVVPPIINLTSPDGTCDPDYVPNVARPMRARTAIANASGSGGQDCVVVFTAPG